MAGQTKKIDVKDLLKEELIERMRAFCAEGFRAQQVLNWVYKKGICDFDRMTNLSPSLRNEIKDRFYISDLELDKELISEDETRKFLYRLEESQKIEGAYIPSRKTQTVCISSQVGCKFACRFCASGMSGFIRNLRPAEMVNQVLYLKKAGHKVTNVVFMGTGEPFDNYDNVLKAVRLINAPYGLGIGQRKITISTAGIIPGINRLSDEG